MVILASMSLPDKLEEKVTKGCMFQHLTINVITHNSNSNIVFQATLINIVLFTAERRNEDFSKPFAKNNSQGRFSQTFTCLKTPTGIFHS